jgi:hypothetical protein
LRSWFRVMFLVRHDLRGLHKTIVERHRYREARAGECRWRDADSRRRSHALFARLRQKFTPQQLVELTGTLAWEKLPRPLRSRVRRRSRRLLMANVISDLQNTHHRRKWSSFRLVQPRRFPHEPIPNSSRQSLYGAVGSLHRSPSRSLDTSRHTTYGRDQMFGIGTPLLAWRIFLLAWVLCEPGIKTHVL